LRLHSDVQHRTPNFVSALHNDHRDPSSAFGIQPLNHRHGEVAINVIVG